MSRPLVISGRSSRRTADATRGLSQIGQRLLHGLARRLLSGGGWDELDRERLELDPMEVGGEGEIHVGDGPEGDADGDDGECAEQEIELNRARFEQQHSEEERGGLDPDLSRDGHGEHLLLHLCGPLVTEREELFSDGDKALRAVLDPGVGRRRKEHRAVRHHLLEQKKILGPTSAVLEVGPSDHVFVFELNLQLSRVSNEVLADVRDELRVLW